MAEKGNNKILFILLGILAVLVVILAAAVGVKLSGTERSGTGPTEKDFDVVREMSDDRDSAGKGQAVQETVQETDEGVEEGKPGMSPENKDSEKPTANTGGEDLEKQTADVKKSAMDENHENNIGKSAFTAADYPDDEEIRAALMAYQEYVDQYNDGRWFDGYLLAYLDEDDIPELIAIGNCEAAGQLIITYRDGELLENGIGRLGGLKYAKKQNFYYNSNGNMGSYRDEFFRLVNGEQVMIMSGYWGDKRDEEGKIIMNEAGDYPEQEYVWNNTVCSEEEYYDSIDKFIKETVGDAELIKVDAYGDDLYDNIPEAYEGLKYRKYFAYWPQIKEFTLENGILTYSVGGASYYGWGDNDDIVYTISYPVAKDCIWEERGRGGREHYQLEVADTDYIRGTTFAEIKERIDAEKKLFDEAVSALGRDQARVESPVSVMVVVKEGVVVRVYTVSS